jgi:hypothetical protein
MAYPIEHKLVIGIASSALFDLTESHQVYLESGAEEYRKYQEQHIDAILDRGVAFPFIRRFLSINKHHPQASPVEVVLFSRNSTETGLRVMNSIAHYGLDISRACFLTGQSPYTYLPAFNTSLFLSANELDVRSALDANFPAGLVLPSRTEDDEADGELRIAFDFDGVIADDESETVFKRNNNVDEFHAHELERVAIPHQPGPLADLRPARSCTARPTPTRWRVAALALKANKADADRDRGQRQRRPAPARRNPLVRRRQTACHLLPDWETLPYDAFSPHQDLVSERLATLHEIRNGQCDVLVVPATTALVRLAPPSFLAAYTFFFRQGETWTKPS